MQIRFTHGRTCIPIITRLLVLLIAGLSFAAAQERSATDKPMPGSIAVPADQPWTPTNVVVRRGDRVRFVGTGNIMVSPTGSAGVAGAEIQAFGKLPVQTLPPGALIGRVGDNRPFAIGSNQDAITMTDSGPLQLGINDEYFEDNSGTFYVRVVRVPR